MEGDDDVGVGDDDHVQVDDVDCVLGVGGDD